MHAILYSPADRPFIESIANFVEHLMVCVDCRDYAKTPDGAEYWGRAVDRLNALSLLTFDPVDLHSVRDFCEAWLRLHDILGSIERLEEAPGVTAH